MNQIGRRMRCLLREFAMTNQFRLFAGPAALLAASSLAMPAHAAPLHVAPQAGVPAGAVSGWSVDDETVHDWGRHRRWRHDHVDAGDVFAGLLILGGVVAVASAIDNSNKRKYRDRDDRYRDYREQDYDRDAYRYRDYPERDSRYSDGSRRGIDGAIDDCVNEVERDARVDTVDTAGRDASGWRVEGELRGGGHYTCKIGPDGRIRDVDIDRGRRVGTGYDDGYYAAARARQGATEPDRPAATDASTDWERGAPDDRYQTAQGPGYAMAN